MLKGYQIDPLLWIADSYEHLALHSTIVASKCRFTLA
jgi:hypothetical protein